VNVNKPLLYIGYQEDCPASKNILQLQWIFSKCFGISYVLSVMIKASFSLLIFL